MKKKLISIFLISSLSFLYAEEPLKDSGYDNKIQEIIYNSQSVAEVKVKAGVATLIQLSDEEYIGGDNVGSGFAVGDPMAWDISVRKNNIFLRPKAPEPDTNIIFTTNKRTYSMILKSVDEEQDPTFVLRFKYPEDEALKRKKERELKAKEARERQKQIAKNKTIPCTDGGWINTDYLAKGSDNIKPIHIWDDGTFTCFKWRNNSDLPVVYKLLDSNKEQITNYHMHKDIMVIHEVSRNFILRFGDSVVEVKTDRNINKGFNWKATTVPNEALVKK